MSKRIKALIAELEEMLLAMQPVPPENTWLSLATMLRQSKNLLTSANTLAKRLKVDFEEAKPARIDTEPSLGIMIIVDGSGLEVPHEPAGCVVRMKVTGAFPSELGAMYFGGHIADVVAMNLDRAFDTLKVSSDDSPVPMTHEPAGELEGAIALARSEGYAAGVEAERDHTRQVASERDVQRQRAETAELALAKARAER